MTTTNFRGVGKAARASGLPGLFVVLALLALVVVPIGVQRRAQALRDEVNEIAVPAQQRLTEIRYLLARQTSSLRGFMITRDSSYLVLYAELSAAEQAIYPELEAFAASLSTELVADVAELRTLSDQWHERLTMDVIVRVQPFPAAAEPILEEDLYRGSLDAAARATATARRLMLEREAAIRAVDRNSRIVYGLLFLLGVAAALSVAVLIARIRSLAIDAENRRQEIEGVMRTTERAVAARADLIRGFTHDVKNPLGAADGFAELLEMGLRGDLSDVQMSTVQRIRAAIRGAIEIINELLDLSRLESGGLQVSRMPVDLPSLVNEVVDHHARAAESGGLDLRLVAARSRAGSGTTYTDPDRVRQVLQNLISNAVKYTPPLGIIRVEVIFTGSDPLRAGSWAKIKVADSGPGIPAEEQDRIFDEFHRVPGSTGAGHGLGLAISRRIARLLGGDVTVRSTLGQGATFELWLPLRGEADAPLGASALPPTSEAGQTAVGRGGPVK